MFFWGKGEANAGTFLVWRPNIEAKLSKGGANNSCRQGPILNWVHTKDAAIHMSLKPTHNALQKHPSIPCALTSILNEFVRV